MSSSHVNILRRFRKIPPTFVARGSLLAVSCFSIILFFCSQDLSSQLSAPSQSQRNSPADTRDGLKRTSDTDVRIGTVRTTGGEMRLVEGILCNGSRTTSNVPLINFNQQICSFTGSKNSNRVLIYRKTAHSGGFGSSLWGIANVFLLAMLTKRKFVIEYEHPQSLTECFQPNMVNWNVQVSGIRFTEHLIDKPFDEVTLESSNLEMLWENHDTVEVIGANMPCEPSIAKNFNYDLTSYGITRPCQNTYPQQYAENHRRINTQMHLWKSNVWHALFRPTKSLLHRASPVIDKMREFDFVLGLHIRLGGDIGGGVDALRTGKECSHSCLPQDFDHSRWFASCALNITQKEQSRMVF
jgi:hypothetical protein